MSNETKSDAPEKPPTFAVVELMGHVRLSGRLSEEDRFGSKMGRLDTWTDDGPVTIYFGGASVYRITVVSEDVARHVAKGTQPQPVSAWDFPKLLGVAAQGEGAAPHDDDAVDLGARIPNLDDDSGFTLDDHGEKDDRPF